MSAAATENAGSQEEEQRSVAAEGYCQGGADERRAAAAGLLSVGSVEQAGAAADSGLGKGEYFLVLK
ncbi:hypothetical protein ACWDY4_46655 [Streptomyces olivaceoviridis]